MVKLTKDIEFFKNYENKESKVHQECCQFMKHQKCEIGEIVFEIGTLGERFYIILNGTVGVNIKSNLLNTIVENQKSPRN